MNNEYNIFGFLVDEVCIVIVQIPAEYCNYQELLTPMPG